MTEADLQRIIVQAIKLYYPQLVINLSLSGINLSGLNSKQVSVIFKDLKQQGFRRGIPDLLIYLPQGKVLNLELKRPNGGVQSKDQKLVEEALKDLEHNYYIIRDKQELYTAIIYNTTIEYRMDQYRELMGQACFEDTELTSQFLFFPIGAKQSEVSQYLKGIYGLTHF